MSMDRIGKRPPMAWSPLPRLSPALLKSDGEERYEVVIIGAGPAGLLLQYLLSSYGINDDSLLCIDAKPHAVQGGHADGLQPRTLEVLKSLGLADRILQDGRHLSQFAFWEDSALGKIQRSFIAPTSTPAARYPHVVTTHQGIVEQEIEAGVGQFSDRGVQRCSRLVDVEIDGDSDCQFPVIAHVDVNGELKTIRSRFLVAADGAHSTVRKCVGAEMKGESQDNVWGVVDLVVDTNFPDIQRRCLVQSQRGSVFVIPREQVSPGVYLTRLYVEMKEQNVDHRSPWCISVDGIVQRAAEAFHPYYFRPRGEDGVHWWSWYKIGQRILDNFILSDSDGTGRIFFTGDACHTHSPKAGQGMNISMMDTYNLSWKLAYSVLGLSADPNHLLATYHTERFAIAERLINSDRGYAKMFRAAKPDTDVPHSKRAMEDFIETYRQSNGFTSGCGIQYPESVVTHRSFSGGSQKTIMGTVPEQGTLEAGTRIQNVRLERFADGSQFDLHDDLPSNGRFRILCFTSRNLLDPTGRSAQALRCIGLDILPRSPIGTVEQLVVYPGLLEGVEWYNVPDTVRRYSEMRFYKNIDDDGLYEMYGVSPAQGACAVLRPDGYIGVVAQLSDLQRIGGYLEGCIVTVK